MTERQRLILAAIIEQHAEIAAPVGSVMLAKLFGVSSATIRSEMAKLEEMGFIVQPHTSAGRIPTDAGYRFYVHSLNEAQAEQPQQLSIAVRERSKLGSQLMVIVRTAQFEVLLIASLILRKI